MGRLDAIIQRNKYPKRFGEKLTIGIGLGLFTLLVLFMMLFTDWGERPADPPAPAAPSSVDPTDRRVDDIKLYTPRKP